MRAEILVLNSRDKKHLRQQLEEQFGVKTIPDKVFFCINKKEKVYISNRDVFSVNQDILRTNALGNYFGTYMKDGFRLSMEGSQIIGPQATTGVIELSKAQRDKWIQGEDLALQTDMHDGTYVLVKFQNDFYACGKVKQGTLLNYVPKSRKLKHVFSQDDDLENDNAQDHQ